MWALGASSSWDSDWIQIELDTPRLCEETASDIRCKKHMQDKTGIERIWTASGLV